MMVFLGKSSQHLCSKCYLKLCIGQYFIEFSSFCILYVLIDDFWHTDLTKQVGNFSVLSAKCLAAAYLGFFKKKEQYCWVIECDLHDRTGMKSEDRHHKVNVSMLGRFTQFDTSGSSTVQRISNRYPPYNATVPYPAQESTYRTFK